MVAVSCQTAPVYRPRQPRASPLYRLIERYLPEFERTYDQRYAPRYGSWRPIIGHVARKFLRCGDLHFGFARVRCPDCRHEMFVASSCRQRCLCPSCHQKRTLLAADTIAHTVCQAVPHRQLVFTIPKRLRLYFRYDRSLLGELARAAWESVVEVVRDVLGRDDLVPGLIAGIQTFGESFRPSASWSISIRTSTRLPPTAGSCPTGPSYACPRSTPAACWRHGKPGSSSSSWRPVKLTSRPWTRCAAGPTPASASTTASISPLATPPVCSDWPSTSCVVRSAWPAWSA